MEIPVLMNKYGLAAMCVSPWSSVHASTIIGPLNECSRERLFAELARTPSLHPSPQVLQKKNLLHNYSWED